MTKITVFNQSKRKLSIKEIDLELQKNHSEFEVKIQDGLGGSQYQRMIQESDWAVQKMQGTIQSMLDEFQYQPSRYDLFDQKKEVKGGTTKSIVVTIPPSSITLLFQEVLKYFNQPDLKAAETLLKTLYMANKQKLAELIKATDFIAKVDVPPRYQEYFQWRLFRFLLRLYKDDNNLTVCAKVNLGMADHYHTQAVNKAKEEKSDIEARKLYLKAAGHYAIASLAEKAPSEMAKQAEMMCINTVNLLMDTDELSFADIQKANPGLYGDVIDAIISATITAENRDLLTRFEHQLCGLFQSTKEEYTRLRFLGRPSIPRASLLEPEQRNGVMWDDVMRMRR